MALGFRFATQFTLSSTQISQHNSAVNWAHTKCQHLLWFCWDTHTNNRNSSLQHHDWGMEVQLLSTKGERRCQLCGWSAETRAESSRFCAPASPHWGCAITLPKKALLTSREARRVEQGCMPAGLSLKKGQIVVLLEYYYGSSRRIRRGNSKKPPLYPSELCMIYLWYKLRFTIHSVKF